MVFHRIERAATGGGRPAEGVRFALSAGKARFSIALDVARAAGIDGRVELWAGGGEDFGLVGIVPAIAGEPGATWSTYAAKGGRGPRVLALSAAALPVRLRFLTHGTGGRAFPATRVEHTVLPGGGLRVSLPTEVIDAAARGDDDLDITRHRTAAVMEVAA